MTNEEAKKILDEVIPPPNHHTVDYEHLPIAIAWATIKQALEKQAADVVEVVRCKDCEHYYSFFSVCDFWDEDGANCCENGYCSYGKRKEKTDDKK